MEDVEDTQLFNEYALPDILPLILENSMVMKVMNLFREEGTIQILNLVM